MLLTRIRDFLEGVPPESPLFEKLSAIKEKLASTKEIDIIENTETEELQNDGPV